MNIFLAGTAVRVSAVALAKEEAVRIKSGALGEPALPLEGNFTTPAFAKGYDGHGEPTAAL
jgi:hypothetical protein